jgi:16S rRNA C967 or C1407 C5-methylase (RsmB/RsmF family)
MTYSTCTIHAGENESMVQFILDSYPEMRLLPINIGLGLPGLPQNGLSDEHCDYVRRFDPGRCPGTPGFFIAKFRKGAD